MIFKSTIEYLCNKLWGSSNKISVGNNSPVTVGNSNSTVNNSHNKVIYFIVNKESESFKEELHKALNDVGNWFCYNGPGGFYFFNENFPHVRFVVEPCDEEFYAFWVPKGPGCSKSWRYLVKLYFRDQAYPHYDVVAVGVDDLRSFIAAPDRWDNCSDEPKGNEVSSFFYVNESRRFLFNRIFLAAYPQYDSRFEFPVFESKNVAATLFSNDVRGERKYFYHLIRSAEILSRRKMELHQRLQMTGT